MLYLSSSDIIIRRTTACASSRVYITPPSSLLGERWPGPQVVRSAHPQRNHMPIHTHTHAETSEVGGHVMASLSCADHAACENTPLASKKLLATVCHDSST